ncbi:MAG: VWA domain-containing protein [Deltaproteobacteria bacterium]|nr:VWA domain-containing protein [Deltaproteobacteria bacterium]
MKKFKFLGLWLLLAFILPYTNGGCSGGGSGGGSSDPSIAVTPSAYDFACITPENAAAPLIVEISNNGTRNLAVSDIRLTDPDNFSLDLNSGSNPCTTISPNLGEGEVCTVKVAFNPLSDASYTASLIIESNDAENPQFDLKLTGISEPITEISVRINQVDSNDVCPEPAITAYVSVLDQCQYPVKSLPQGDFSILEGVNNRNITEFTFVSPGGYSLSVALVLDYSGSITNKRADQGDMEAAAALFVNQIGSSDEAEIIKFATKFQVAQAFTSDSDALNDTIFADPGNIGGWTALYDAIYKAIEDTALRGKDRKAIIVLTDGRDVGDDKGGPGSVKTLAEVIQEAQNQSIPLFTIGVGDNYAKYPLERMADTTGGEFFISPNSDYLNTIYQQLAALLFENQYIIKYDSSLMNGDKEVLGINVSLQGTNVIGDNTKEITPCP